jgi:hypothetical protein
VRNQGIGRAQDIGSGAIILLQLEHLRVGIVAGELPQVLDLAVHLFLALGQRLGARLA